MAMGLNSLMGGSIGQAEYQYRRMMEQKMMGMQNISNEYAANANQAVAQKAPEPQPNFVLLLLED